MCYGLIWLLSFLYFILGLLGCFFIIWFIFVSSTSWQQNKRGFFPHFSVANVPWTHATFEGAVGYFSFNWSKCPVEMRILWPYRISSSAELFSEHSFLNTFCFYNLWGRAILTSPIPLSKCETPWCFPKHLSGPSTYWVVSTHVANEWMVGWINDWKKEERVGYNCFSEILKAFWENENHFLFSHSDKWRLKWCVLSWKTLSKSSSIAF